MLLNCMALIVIHFSTVGFCLQLSFTKRIKRNSVLKELPKRHTDAALNFRIINNIYYETILNIGTPPQAIPVLLDTGSSDLWIQTINHDKDVVNDGLVSKSLTMFHPDKSSTCQFLNIGRFFISYSDKTYSDGTWVTDNIEFAGNVLDNIQFALTSNASTPVSGVLGLGFPARESVQGYDGALGTVYPNFPQVLKQQGLVSTVAYSLSIDTVSGTGNLLFGCIDKSSFSGPLFTFPMVNVYPKAVLNPATLALTLDSIGISSDCKSWDITNSKLPALLDSGTTLMDLPAPIANKISELLNAHFDSVLGVYVMDCPVKESIEKIDITFRFGNLTVPIPLEKFILPPDESSGGLCGLGILPTNGEDVTLGDLFLSEVYSVFDLDNYLISLALIKHENSTNGNVVDIPSNGIIEGAIFNNDVPWQHSNDIVINSEVPGQIEYLCSFSSKLGSSKDSTKTASNATTSEKFYGTISNTTIPFDQGSILLGSESTTIDENKKISTKHADSSITSKSTLNILKTVDKNVMNTIVVSVTTSMRSTTIITKILCTT